jgi:ABC-type phosphate transport system permease subunit
VRVRRWDWRRALTATGSTGAMLAIARVSGETAPLLLTVLGSRFFN